jgi:hypothetical protein
MEPFTTRELIAETVSKLFIYTDTQQWEKLQTEVFTPELFFDMSSITGEAGTSITAKEVCNNWQQGFKELDSVNHLSGNYLITVEGTQADVFCYATATHYKKAATQGTTREMVGTYNLHLLKTEAGWRVNRFIYHLKYIAGNTELK